MPKVIDKDRWALGKRLYAEGESLAGISRQLGCSVTAVRNHRDKDGWVRDAVVTADDVAAVFKPEQTIEVPATPESAADNRVAELERALAEERAEKDVLAGQVEDQKETREVKIYENPEQVEEYYGAARIDDMVALEFGQTNLERAKQGLAPIKPEDIAPEAYAAKRAEILQDFVDRRTKWVNPESVVRVVKLWNPHTKSIWQCPVESQFNNEAGVAGSAVRKYKDRGHKLVVPYGCQRFNCWADAAQADGKMTYEGYCSPAHLATDPYISAERKQGITTTAMAAV